MLQTLEMAVWAIPERYHSCVTFEMNGGRTGDTLKVLSMSIIHINENHVVLFKCRYLCLLSMAHKIEK